jgi:DNA-binding MarR family transcriptional regulator
MKQRRNKMANKYFSDNAKTVVTFLREHQGVDLVQNDIADATGIARRSMTGLINSLVKKDVAIRDEVEIAEGKTVKYVRLTDLGMTIDLDMDKPVKA